MNMKQVLEGVDGIICIGKFEKKYLDTFSKLSSRIVLLDMDLSPITNVCISLDFDDAMCKVVNYFHSQGHKTIGFMGRNEYDEMSLQTISRKKSFIKYCEYLGIKYEIFTTNHEMTGDEGYSVMNRVIEEGKIPSAIFCAQTLADGVSDLKDGADTLSDASDDVVDGISELKDGAEDLKDGMQEFYDEGISKIKDLADENLTVILDRLKALTSDEISYDTYSGRSDSMNGSVKFIIETDEIE